jgi:hypothetical protein
MGKRSARLSLAKWVVGGVGGFVAIVIAPLLTQYLMNRFSLNGPAAPPSSETVRRDHLEAVALRSFKGPGAVLTLVRADLQAADEKVRPSYRYFSLVHLWNMQTVRDEDLRAWREGLVRAVAALAPAGRTAVIEPLDPEQTVYRLNLAVLDWDDEGKWRPLLSVYPYLLSPVGLDAAKVRDLSDSEQACVRGDWFLAVLTRPPSDAAGSLPRLPAQDLPSAVEALARAYPSRELDLQAITADLGLPDASLVRECLEHRPAMLTGLGLDQLLAGKTVRRTDWESLAKGSSPYQQLARELKLGTPLRIR